MVKRSDSTSTGAALKGDLFLESADRQSFDSRQIALLQAIKTSGSISAAAKTVGISYKTAWDRLNAMNNLSEKPLVNRAAGGPQGGGTQLTAFGEEVLSGLQALQEEHADFVAKLGENVQGLGDLSSFLRSSNLRTSARNQFRGSIQRVIPGTVNTEIEIALSRSLSIVATITNDSYKRMELAIGVEVIALIKSSWVLLSAQMDAATSARNQLPGTVSQIIKGEVDAEITLDLGDGKSLCSVITAASCEAMELAEGQTLTALFKASSVILMRP